MLSIVDEKPEKIKASKSKKIWTGILLALLVGCLICAFIVAVEEPLQVRKVKIDIAAHGIFTTRGHLHQEIIDVYKKNILAVKQGFNFLEKMDLFGRIPEGISRYLPFKLRHRFFADHDGRTVLLGWRLSVKRYFCQLIFHRGKKTFSYAFHVVLEISSCTLISLNAFRTLSK